MAAIDMNSILEQTGIPCAYGRFIKGTAVPYIAWIGGGQRTFQADNTHYYRKNEYQIEFYFKLKSPDLEETIEQVLLDNGLLYEKSEDVYLDEEGVFLIYYNV